MSSETAIEIANLSKCYHVYDQPRDRLKQFIIPRIQRMLGLEPKNYFREFWALKDVSFEIAKGETIGIIGRNGCGKSTLLQMICGTLNPTGGSVTTSGRITALLELGSGFNPEFTGRENVYINASVHGLNVKEIDSRFDEIAAFADIGNFIEQPVKTYSSGMLMRLAFAVSICLDPDILIIDEALAVGDAAFQFKCLDRLAILSNRGTSILFVSHDMNMIKRFCHRVLYLGKDQIRASGTPEEMAEFYLLEMREGQRHAVSGDKVPVTLKRHFGSEDGIAYGTHEGQIVSAHFINTEGSRSSYAYGEVVEMHAKATLSNAIAYPNISFTIQDSRLIVIGGGNFPLRSSSAGNGYETASITVKFRTNLSPGNYYVTIKLMDGHTEETSSLIEKQVAILSFEMLPGNKIFLGTVDLGIEEVL